MELMTKPNIYLFRVCAKCYIYDVVNNTIFKVSHQDFDYISKLFHNEEIRESDLKGNKLFSDLIRDGFLKYQMIEKIEHPLNDKLEHLLSNQMHMLTLQVTQNCNLRCKYCVYSGSYMNRQHSNKRMGFETARKAIDYYINSSSQLDTLSFAFYGGEPLLEMDLIRSCVDYINQKSFGREVIYNITTNATLINKECMDFFNENRFHIMISLDGPKVIHDQNRVFASNNQGTFDRVMESLKLIKEQYPDLPEVRFSTVLNPKDEYKGVGDFFSNDIRVNDFQVFSTEQNDVNFKEELNASKEYVVNRSHEQFKMIYKYFRHIDQRKLPLVDNYFTELKKNVFDRIKRDGSGLKINHPSGPCVPGLQRLFVTADGKILPCERVSEVAVVMQIGDVDSGVDIEKSRRLLNVGKITEEHCKKCWAFRFCTACAAYAENGDRLSDEKRLSRCTGIRSYADKNIKEYCILKDLGADFTEFESEELIK